MVAGRNEPQLASPPRGDCRGDRFDQCAPDSGEAVVDGYRDCRQLGPIPPKSVGGDAVDAIPEPGAKAGSCQDIVHLTKTRLLPTAECSAEKSFQRHLVSRRRLPDGNLAHATRLPARSARSHAMCGYFARFVLALLPEVLSATAARTSALNAPASTFSPSWMSIARLVFPPRLELKSLAGSFNDAPLAKVSFTTDLYVSPVQMIPSCDHVGVPGLVALTHFTSSTTAGSACLMSLRIRLRVSPRQPPVSAIPLSISSDADWSS